INGVATDYVTNSMNQYVQVGGDQYLYDADGNLTSITGAGGTFTFTYDEDDLLTGATTPDGNWAYEYDALGDRRATVVNGVTTEYLVDPTGRNNLVGEYTGGTATHYVYGFGLVSRVAPDGAAGYDLDGLGSVAAVVGANGATLDHYVYGPFGEQL